MRLQYTQVEMIISNGHFNLGVLQSHDVWDSKQIIASHYLSASERSSFTQRYIFSSLVQDGS
jgi:hypothetical protein